VPIFVETWEQRRVESGSYEKITRHSLLEIGNATAKSKGFVRLRGASLPKWMIDFKVCRFNLTPLTFRI
jgi:hypothetical protein